MAIPKNIVVVCEGESEWTYLQRLNSALAAEPFPEGWVEPPVRFIGRPKKTGVGKGAFKAVEREPLHWDDYKGHFEKVIPGYRKGGLPADFVTLASLGNLNRHLSQMPATDLKDLQVERTFAASVLKEVSRWYAIPGMT